MISQSYTIVVVQDACISRVDLRDRSGVQIQNACTADRDPNQGLGKAVESALRLSDGKCGRIWVFSSEFWAGEVALPKEVRGAIDDEQLVHALAIEAECDSGISPFESHIGFMPISETGSRGEAWWVSQVEFKQVEEIESAIARLNGSKNRFVLDGVCTTVLSPDVRIDDVTAFVTTWFSEWKSDPKTVPAIVLTQHGLTEKHITQIGLVAASVALVGCCLQYGHAISNYHALLEQNQLMSVRFKELQSRRDEPNQIAREITQLEQQANKITEQREQLITLRERKVSQRNVLRNRAADILNALSATSTDDHWVQHLEMEQSNAKISGLAVSSQAAAQFARNLDEYAQVNEWRVLPARIVQSKSVDLTAFEITLEDRSSAGKSTIRANEPSRRSLSDGLDAKSERDLSDQFVSAREGLSHAP